MTIFKKQISKSNQMLTIIILCFGVILTVTGLYLGLKNFDPKYFTTLVGFIGAILTIFGLFGNLSKEIKSSKTQQEIKDNTERNLQPLAISSLYFHLEYGFDNPKISSVLEKIYDLKIKQEKLLKKSPPAVNGQRKFESLPGIETFELGNEITGLMIILDPNFLKECDFPFPNLKIQLSPRLLKEIITSNGDGTNTVNIDFPVSLEFEVNSRSQYLLQQILVDFKEKKINVKIQPTHWEYSLDNGEIVSFKDLFGKILQLSAYYSYWKDNEKKINIITMILYNDRKRMQFIFKPEEKSKSIMVFNAAYLHQIVDEDFYK